LIEIKNINKSFGDRQVVHDVSFDFHPGKCNLIIGESGSGKTTIMKMMVGLLVPDSGDIIYDGESFLAMTAKQKQDLRKKIGMLFQGGALFDSMTVEENVMFPMEMFTDMTKEEKIERANFCLSRVKLDNRNKLYPGELSGGMKKRAALARALSINPKYLFCDEPNSGLDPRTSIVIDELIREVTEEFNITTMVVTHDMNSVLGIGHHILYIYKGHKWWEGNNRQILKADNKELVDFVYASEMLKELRPKS
jgi:phospholipid/cholesterol/gamma-HCH transport system ATP-binding protein